MANSFCRFFSNGYSFAQRPDGEFMLSPCSLRSDLLILPVKPGLLEARKKIFAPITDWTPKCSLSCQILENSGQQSHRQSSFDWIPEDADQEAIYLELCLDTICNAACVICDERQSSLWQKENLKLKKIPIKIKQPDVQSRIDSIVNNISLDKVKYLKFYGGEPLFTDSHIRFIDHLSHPENITLQYTTNASIFPNKETLARWEKFKTVIFSASIDGIGTQFDYVRWPLRWDKVSRNLIRLKELGLHNLMFRVEYTANILNTYYYNHLETWIQDNIATNKFGDKTDVNIHLCEHSPFDPHRMPVPLRDFIKEKYPKNHVIHNLIENLGPDLPLEPWIEFVNTWDDRRKMYWYEAFPEIKKFFPNK